jgi:YVTN family beta-propeller protein
MHRRDLLTGVLCAAASLLLPPSAATGRGSSGFVYTADEHGNSISAIDLSTSRVTVVPVAISPHNIQVSADGARILAVGEPAKDGDHSHGAGDHANKANGRLLVFDPKRLRSGPIATVLVGKHPAHVVLDSTGKRAFVTLAGSDAVVVVDLARGQIARRMKTGRYPHGLRISPDDREIYVANVEDGSVSVIDLASGAEGVRIPVGRAPVQVGFTPDGARVYVSLRDENRIAAIDTASRTVIGRIPVGRGPIQVHSTPDGRFVYVANQGTDLEPADTVSVIDVSTNSVVDTIRTGAGAHGVTVSNDGRFVFVTNIVESTVTAIDAETRSVVATFAVGKGPNGISFRSSAA